MKNIFTKTALALLLALTFQSLSAQILYVRAGGSGTRNGSSWQNASGDLQAMINASQTGGQVWVAFGTYYPTERDPLSLNDPDPRTLTFMMKSNVVIYGGFVGNESELSARNWRTNQTILSGDIGIAGNNSDNCYTVISNKQSDGTLDGFIITGGNANKVGIISNGLGLNKGAGMFNYGASVNILNCTFINNSSLTDGGAIYNYNCRSNIRSCVFTNNSAQSSGGAVYGLSSSPTIEKSIFNANTATIGGAIWHEEPLVLNGGTVVVPTTIQNCLFYGNTTNQANSANFRSQYSDALSIRNCTFYGNNGRAIILGGQLLGNLIFNTIIWANTVNSTGVVTNSANSIIEGGNTANNNKIDNPLFVNINNPIGTDNVWGTADDGLRLTTNSPAINAGDAAYSSSTDIMGIPILALPDIGAYEYNPTLPVTLLGFEASKQNNNALLRWSTASEKDNKHFEVQHSTDGKVFTTVATVASKGDQANQYAYVHTSPANGINYYRLVQTDIDGKQEIFAVKSIRFDLSEQPALTLYPNPAEQEITVQTIEELKVITIYDLQGKKIISHSAKGKQFALSVNQLPAGVYVLKAQTEVGVETEQFVKK